MMEFKIESRPDYGFLTVNVPEDKTISVEASSMATMSPNMEMKTKMRGGFSRLLTGESLFLNKFTARGGDGEIGIAPGPSGDIEHFSLDGDTVYLSASSYMASCQGIRCDSKWQGFTKGLFSGESFFFVKCTGKGDLWFNTYGAIIPIDVKGEYTVDTGHIVGFTDGLDYSISRLGGFKSLFFSGEGFVCKFRGEGKLWVQTKNPNNLVWWAHWYRRVVKKNSR